MSMIFTLLARILLLVVLGYLLVCAYVFFRQRAMLYHPQTVPEEQMLEAARGLGVSRWLDKTGNPLGWMTPDGTEETPVLIFHGNAGTALDRTVLIEKLRDAGVESRIFVVDYPGYGSAPGTPSQQNLVAAGVKALQALPDRAIVVGESLGTGVAAQVAEKCPGKIQGLLLITPFDSMVSAASHHYPWLPVGLLLLDRFDSIRALEQFSSPVAVVLAENDDTTPPDGARRLFEGLHGPKKLWAVKGTGHNGVISTLSAEEWHEIRDFLASGAR